MPEAGRFAGGLTWALFLLAAGATLTIWLRDPFPGWSYEVGVFVVGMAACWRVWAPGTWGAELFGLAPSMLGVGAPR